MEIHRGQALQFAAKIPNNLEVFRAILESGPTREVDRNVSLMYAAGEGHMEVVQEILGARDANDQPRVGNVAVQTALEEAVNHRQEVVVQVILKHCLQHLGVEALTVALQTVPEGTAAAFVSENNMAVERVYFPGETVAEEYSRLPAAIQGLVIPLHVVAMNEAEQQGSDNVMNEAEQGSDDVIDEEKGIDIRIQQGYGELKRRYFVMTR